MLRRERDDTKHQKMIWIDFEEIRASLNCFVLQTSGGRGKNNTGASAGCGGVRCSESKDARDAEGMYLVAFTR
jgi:hypothetical protein